VTGTSQKFNLVAWNQSLNGATGKKLFCICAKNRPGHDEPLQPIKFSERPWEMIATELFHLKMTIVC
jgi:hypothetical protein